MNKFKTGLLLLTTLFLFGTLRAQSIEEGRKFIYYERYKSAKDVFEKLVQANPNNLPLRLVLNELVQLLSRNLVPVCETQGHRLGRPPILSRRNSLMLDAVPKLYVVYSAT